MGDAGGARAWLTTAPGTCYPTAATRSALPADLFHRGSVCRAVVCCEQVTLEDCCVAGSWRLSDASENICNPLQQMELSDSLRSLLPFPQRAPLGCPGAARRHQRGPVPDPEAQRGPDCRELRQGQGQGGPRARTRTCGVRPP